MFNFFYVPVIFFIIVYTVLIVMLIIIIKAIFLFLFFNSLKIGLKVVKKNPISVAIKNLGNLYKFFQKFDIMFYYIVYEIFNVFVF